jgi:hypothetical protein
MRKVVQRTPGGVHLLSIVLILAAGLTPGAGRFCKASESNPSTSPGTSLAKENAELKQRVEKLEGEMKELKKTVPSQPGATEQTKLPVWSSLDIQIYGYLKFDAAYDTSRINNGDYAKWVDRENMNEEDDQFNATANESRLGVMFNGPDNRRAKTSGRVEIDFYGGGSENKANPMMRHAYIKLDWPDERFNIIAGQTSDVISPLVPSTVNYSVCWWVGNIGYRRPQFRLTKEYSLTSDVDLKFEGALARTIGRADAVAVPNGTKSGEDAGFPSVQARASVTLPFFGPDRTTMGVSGHWGREEYDTTATGDHKDFVTWSLNFDLTQPVCDKVTVKAELFTGQDLDAYLGGIGQGVITDTTKPNFYEEIGSSGGWIAASLGPWNDTRYNVGVSMDDVDRGNVNDGDRTLNRSVFGNMFYALNKHVDWALELSNWRTEYRGHGDADSLRIQTALIYRF